MTYDEDIILGGDGFIGKYLVARLREMGRNAVSYDIRSGWDLREVAPPVYGRTPYVWFLAWDVGGAKYILNHEKQIDILQNNLRICQIVFSWLGNMRIPSTFVSSQMAGYYNAYGISKLVGQYWATQTPNCIIARFWNVYGHEDVSEQSHVVADLIHSGLRGQVVCMTSGDERRQFTYVKDAVEGLLCHRETGQRLVDITCGEWVTILSVAQIVAEELGVSLERGVLPGYESLVEPGVLPTGWVPQYTLSQGIRQVIETVLQTGR